jgi:hypothetical protein
LSFTKTNPTMTSKKLIFFNLLLAITLFSCEKDETPLKKFDSFLTQPATNITTETATLNGALILGDFAMEECGFYYSTESERFLTNYTTVSLGVVDTDGIISYNLEGLEPNTTYYFRTFVVFEQGGPIGRELSFTTAAAE